MNVPTFSNGKKQDLISAKICLENFERSRMNVPLFSNGKKQDSISAKIWLETFEQEAARLDLSKDKKCMELYLHLREPALAWWPSLKHHDIDPFSEWEKVKSRFLLDFPTNQESNQADFAPKPSKPDLSHLTKKEV